MTVTCSTDDGLAEIRLDRPDRLNSLDAAMVADFHTALDGVGDARAVLVTAAGRAFSAGRDLTDAEPLTEDAEAILGELFNPLLQRLADVEVPTIAAVQGACLGVGLGVAFACDVVIAADDARIGSPFARIGAVLDSGGHRYLVERVGPHRALELIYTGRLLSGTEAAAIGLVNRSVPADELDGEARSLARTHRRRSDGGLPRVQAHRPLAGRGAARRRARRRGRGAGTHRPHRRLRRGHHGVPGEAPAGVHRPLTAATSSSSAGGAPARRSARSSRLSRHATAPSPTTSGPDCKPMCSGVQIADRQRRVARLERPPGEVHRLAAVRGRW